MANGRFWEQVLYIGGPKNGKTESLLPSRSVVTEDSNGKRFTYLRCNLMLGEMMVSAAVPETVAAEELAKFVSENLGTA